MFGDNIDTDAILPGEYLHINDMEELGKVCFEHTNPDFRDKVKQGQSIVVAGRGFGCGSSREQAVTALKGCGVCCPLSLLFFYCSFSPLVTFLDLIYLSPSSSLSLLLVFPSSLSPSPP